MSGVAVVRRARVLRVRAIALAGAVALVVTAGLALSVGDYPLSPLEVLQTLAGAGERVAEYVVFQVRMPRLVMAVLAGGALGIAGALLQALLRNPLASPDLLGISGGSGVAAVFALLVLGVTGPLLAVWAFAGGIVVAALLLVAGGRQAGGYRLILAGIGVAFLCAALTNFLLVRTQVEQAQTALLWLTGSLASTPWWQTATLAVVLAGSIPAVAAAARWLPLYQMGPATAAGLGVQAGRVRAVAIGAAVLLTATTCAFIGPVGFIALCAPAIARPLVGNGQIAVGTSALVGAVALVCADLVAQFALPGLSLPVGVVTGALGAVFLLWILATSKGRQL